MVQALEKASDGLSSRLHGKGSPQMSARNHATIVQEEQVSTHPIVARVLICDPIPAGSHEGPMEGSGLYFIGLELKSQVQER